MASDVGLVTFKEFCPLYYLLNAIPTKVQKGFRSVPVYLTALDANNEYIALGSSIGMLYLYCRRLNQMKKCNLEGKTETITIVKVLSCFDDLVAVGTTSGRVALFQLVSPLPGRNKQLRKFDVVGIHKSTITALTWSANGMKLFSGDNKGKVVCSSLDLDQGVCNPRLVLQEPSSIVQLEYNQKVLLVSTYQRSLLYYTEEKSVKQVGTQPRKSSGKFGACFVPGLCKQSDLTLYASRPGLRLWRSDVHGVVQATFILKDVFSKGVRPFELYPRSTYPSTGSCILPEKNLGLVTCFFHEGWVLSWNENSIYVVDCVNQVVVGGLEGPGDIVSVSCTEHEIFLLKGERDIIRISNRPEGLASIVPDESLRIHSPLATAPSVMPIASVETPQKIRTLAALPEMELSTSSAAPSPPPPGGPGEQEFTILTENIQLQSLDATDDKVDLNNESCTKEKLVTSESRSRSSSTNSGDSGIVPRTAIDQPADEVLTESLTSSQRFSTISVEEFDQELVVQSIKVKKKKKKKEGSLKCQKLDYSEDALCSEPHPVVDSAIPSTCDTLSDRTSLLSSSIDHLDTDSPDRESTVSGDFHSILQEDNSSDRFSLLQSPESISAVQERQQLLLNDSVCEFLRTSNSENDQVPSLVVAENVTLSPLPVLLEDLANSDGFDKNKLAQCDINEDAEKELTQQDQETSNKITLSDEPIKVMKAPVTLESVSLDSAYNDQKGTDPIVCGVSDDERTLKFLQNSSEPSVEEPCSSLNNLTSSNQLLQNTVSVQKDDICSVQALNIAETRKSTGTAEWIVGSYDTKATGEEQRSASSDEEDIYGHGVYHSASETSMAEASYSANMNISQDGMKLSQEGIGFLRSDQLAESWMGYCGPGYGILSLAVSEKYIWCLDYKGTLYCSALLNAGLRWQKFEDNVQQVAASPSGTLLWKVEQKSNKAFACGKVTIKGKRHWYEALPQVSFVALSDDTAWIIRTDGELYLQTGLSVDRPCARAVKVDCLYPVAQVASRNNVVWTLTEQRSIMYREGVSSFCPEGEQWKCDVISERQALDPVCITLGDQQTAWALDSNGNLWFRTGVSSKKPQGEDDHWWQVSITDYVVFDQCSLFQTIIHATQTVATAAQAPVEKVADKLRVAFWSHEPQCQPNLISVNGSGVWITSGKNEFHVAKGNLIGTYWNNVVPRGTASATKWVFVLASPAPTKEGNFLWLGQSTKELFCISDQNPVFRPSTVQLLSDVEMIQFSACQDSIWALDTLGRVYIRTLSKTCPIGMHWTRLDLTQLGAIKLCSVACGGQHIWACDTSGIVYFRVGTQPLNPSMMLPAWITIEPPELPVGMQLVSIYSSFSDQMLWAIDNKGNVHVRLGITEEMPVGTDWEHVPGLQANQLTLSTRTVWVRCPNGDVARRYGVTDKNPAGDYWKKIPGNVTCLTVTPYDELWAIGSAGPLLQRLTKTFTHSDNLRASGSSVSIHTEDFDEEWEVI
ncbi:tectonin beta-propeller repeat-containing protein 2 isoform X2 [Latimeria chalumnae]|nr:PREDICTED: tectonin beta-propeller repeat-containing protein 2 isoform X2 [Latimeria chalumnae]|eukprot:XP_014352831.1 PREDICTED: tectonin beta-propeller repeat-containing protein 2 isoform X2 [Latimeria chalumnae]